ncbi:MAG: PAS domain-containing protein [bacterium]
MTKISKPSGSVDCFKIKLRLKEAHKKLLELKDQTEKNELKALIESLEGIAQDIQKQQTLSFSTNSSFSELEKLSSQTFTARPPTGMLLLDPVTFRVKQATTPRQELFDKSHKTNGIIGCHPSEFVPNFNETGLEEHFRSVVETGLPYVDTEPICLQLPHGAVFMLFSVFPLKQNGTDISDLLVVANEVTEQIISRSKLEIMTIQSHEQAAELKSVFDSITDGFIIYGAEGQIVKMNDSARKLFGYNKEHERMLPKERYKLGRIKHDDGRPIEPDDIQVHRALKGEKITTETLMVTLPGRKTTWVSASAAPLRNTDGSIIGAISLFRDITKETEVHERLQYAYRHLNTILNSMSDALVICDMDRNIIDTNSAVISVFPRGEEMRQLKCFNDCTNVYELHYVDGREMPYNEWPLIRTFNGEVITDYEARIVHKESGDFRYLSYSGSIVCDVNGNPSSVVMNIRDITKRRLAELGRALLIQDVQASRDKAQALSTQLSDERNFLTGILDSIRPVGIAYLDHNQVYRQCNVANAKYIGKKVEEVIGRHFHEVHKDDPRMWDAVGDVIQSGKAFSAPLVSYINPDKPEDGYLQYLVAYVPDKNLKGKVNGVFVLRQDMTDLANSEETIRAEKERLATTIRSIGDGVISTDKEGKVVLMNQKAQELTGFDCCLSIGKPISEVYKIVDETTRLPIKDNFKKVINSPDNTGRSGRFMLIRPDGSDCVIIECSTPIIDTEGCLHGAVYVFCDVTLQTKIEYELARVSKLDSLGLLASGIAHDFNNILAVIMGCVSLVEMTANLTEKETSLIEDAENAIMRARDLVKQMLTFSKGGAPIKTVTSISEMLKEASSFVLHGSKSNCHFEIAEDLWNCDIDTGQVSQVIENLVINANEAMSNGGRITVHAENVFFETQPYFPLEPGNYVQVKVSDQGVGIKSEHVEKIFDPFFTTKSSGTGLGLATVHSIIRKHGGYVGVESSEGKGTTFTFYLPATNCALEVQYPDFSESSIPNYSGHILVMDDEYLIRQVTKSALQNIGCDVEITSDGTEAIRLYEQATSEGRAFDGVILDLTVPGGMGGKETLEKLREIDPNVKAIVISGYSADPILANFKEYGFVGAIAKPFHINDLNKVLNDVLEAA